MHDACTACHACHFMDHSRYGGAALQDIGKHIMSVMTINVDFSDMAAGQKAFARRYGVTLDPDHPLPPYGADGRRSLIAKAVSEKAGARRVSFLPVLIDKQLRPEILKHGDARFEKAFNFMDNASEDFNHRFTVEGDEVMVSGARLSGGDDEV